MVPIRLLSRTALPRNLIGDAHAASLATFISAVLGQLEHLFLENERAYGLCQRTRTGRELARIGRVQ
jgi:hypothetical protein